MKTTPLDTDILITHGPPYGVLDDSPADYPGPAGDPELRAAVIRIKPKLQLLCAFKSGDITQLRRHGDRRYLCDGAQCLQALDHFLYLGRSQLHRLHDALLQPHHPLTHMFDFMQLIQLRRLLSHLRKANLPHPHHVGLRPCLLSLRRALARTQRELAQPVTRPQRILLGCLAWGSPATLDDCETGTRQSLALLYGLIPERTDILITHCPHMEFWTAPQQQASHKDALRCYRLCAVSSHVSMYSAISMGATDILLPVEQYSSMPHWRARDIQ